MLVSLMLALLPLTTQTVAAESHYAAVVLAGHPVAYYQLGEAAGATVAVDSSGDGNNGTYELNPVLGVPGLINNPAATAVDFAPTGNVTIPNAADLIFVNAPFTIEAWVNGTLSTEPCCQGNARIFDKSEAGYGFGYGIDIAATNLRMDGGPTALIAGVALSSDTTYYVVGVSNGKGGGGNLRGRTVGCGRRICAQLTLYPARPHRGRQQRASSLRRRHSGGCGLQLCAAAIDHRCPL